VNRQDLFDTVVAHLLTQKAKALGPVESAHSPEPLTGCMYRAPDGKKCAFGVLIPDGVYRPAIENQPATFVLHEIPELAFLRPHNDLISNLQTVHDAFEPAQWYDQLERLAKEHRLQFNPPTKPPTKLFAKARKKETA
jgi:hypothetical protein